MVRFSESTFSASTLSSSHQASPQSKTPQIRLLPPSVVNQIAAGEVVERPASVVKELVENAIDAGATRLDITISHEGRNIRIADNGSGMAPGDLPLAFTNHATSKITSIDDLSELLTLGFRGEALASIASISRLTCVTRQADAAYATKLTFDSAGQPQCQQTGGAIGTVMQVEDLFYNTPARLKFMKKPATELSYIEEWVQMLAMANPQIQFNLMLGEKSAVKTTGSGDLKTVIKEVFPSLVQDIRWLPIDFEDAIDGFRLSGLASEPDTQKNSRKWVFNFINGRAIRCSVMTKAIEAAYESLLPSGKYPFSVLFLNIPASAVDVNVHPAKREVRYANPNQIFSLVKQGIRRAMEAQGLSLYGLPSPVNVSDEISSETQSRPYSNSGSSNHYSALPSLPRPNPNLVTSPQVHQQAMNLYRPMDDAFTAPQSPLDMRELKGNTPGSTPAISNSSRFKVIGQLFNTYILLETSQGLMVVDQHIASERAFFERFKRNTLTHEPAMQTLLVGPILTFSTTQMALLQQQAETLSAAGFRFERLDSHQLRLTAVPLLYLEKHQPETWFETIVKQFKTHATPEVDIDHYLATIACHSAVRAGDALTQETMERVIEQWLACELPWTCPHGRPIAHTIAAEELNRFFHRSSLPVNSVTNQ